MCWPLSAIVVLTLFPCTSSVSNQCFGTSASVGHAPWPPLHCDVIIVTLHGTGPGHVGVLSAWEGGLHPDPSPSLLPPLGSSSCFVSFLTSTPVTNRVKAVVASLWGSDAKKTEMSHSLIQIQKRMYFFFYQSNMSLCITYQGIIWNITIKWLQWIDFSTAHWQPWTAFWLGYTIAQNIGQSGESGGHKLVGDYCGDNLYNLCIRVPWQGCLGWFMTSVCLMFFLEEQNLVGG